MTTNALGTCTVVFLLVILVMATSGFAAPYPTFHRGVRPLGMGGAFTALADDENALFYNPAGLAAMDRLDLGVFNPMLETSANSIELFEDFQDIDSENEDEVADLMRKYIGEPQHLRAALSPYAGFRVAKVGVMIGAMGSASLDIEVRNPAWPEADVDYVQDLGALGGVGFQVPAAGLRLGASIKMVQRTSLNNTYTAVDIADENFGDRLEEDQNTGSGVSLDVGALYTLPFWKVVETDLALVVQNLPEMDLGDAKDMKTQANFGLAVSKSFARFKLVGTLDYNDIFMNLEEDSDIGKRLHLGLELALPALLAIRGGYNQGYWTAGATLDFRLVRLDFATYGEEVGAYAGQREDRRYIGQITIGW